MSLKRFVEGLPGYNSLVKPWHYLEAVKASRQYGKPAKNLRVVAVTGTNGKTTTCFMIWKMLNEAGRAAGLLTTVGWGGVQDSFSERSTALKTASAPSPDAKSGSVRSSSSPCISSPITLSKENDNKNVALNSITAVGLSTKAEVTSFGGSSSKITSAEDALNAWVLHRQFEHMTTERVEVLNRRMRAIADAGAEFLVLEVTSHALSQSRILGVPIEVAVFTNLTHEHLDYHKTFENYRKAKQKLFKMARYGVVNMDDVNAKYFVNEFASGDVKTYGIDHGDLRATDVKLNSNGVEYVCGDMEIKTRIPGKFNVYNSLAAVGVGKRLGLDDEQIEAGIYALESVEGRMNRIDEGQDFEVIVDYAHTPDALEKVFESLACGTSAEEDKRERTGRVIAVHGGAGRRDESTRAERGEILGKYSDAVIITEDDSRDEDPTKIADMFVEGAKRAGKVLEQDLFVDLNRRSAIEKALRMAKAGDLVLILGKGHEKTILRHDGPHDFEDVKVTREILRDLKKA